MNGMMIMKKKRVNRKVRTGLNVLLESLPPPCFCWCMSVVLSCSTILDDTFVKRGWGGGEFVGIFT